MDIRNEQPSDIDVIRAVTQAAFAGQAHSDQSEGAIIDRLRAADVLSLSLVALEDDEIIAHAAFSPVTIGGRDCGWFGLGPVSVRPDRQGVGVGSALIRDALRRLKADGAGGLILVGDPGYYERFGFRADPRIHVDWVDPKYFQMLAFTDHVPEGEAVYHSAFQID
ncbi:MAG: N-acetyltransferase [Ahrensia sp.]|nr:N-acetyltransferase [Ahrensia sp.]